MFAHARVAGGRGGGAAAQESKFNFVLGPACVQEELARFLRACFIETNATQRLAEHDDGTFAALSEPGFECGKREAWRLLAAFPHAFAFGEIGNE